jgi:hypothetical protein
MNAPAKRIFLNINNPLDLAEAAKRVAIDKQVIAVNFHTFGLMGPATSVDETLRISLPKGHHELKPHTLVINQIQDIIPIIDRTRLHESLSHLIDEPEKLLRRIAHRSHVRLPVIPQATFNDIPLHAGIISYEANNPLLPVLQFIIFKGIIQTFISTTYTLGLKLGAVTSMNYKTLPTITTVKDALAFVEQNQVGTFIFQPNIKIMPSFSGIALTQTGVQVVREGNLPISQLASLWTDVPFSINAPAN